MPPVVTLFVYAITLFLGAGLLFVVQPMVGKMILPLLGGTPAVWSTCLVFFQSALLAGYAYAHATTTWLGTRRQALVHLAVLALPLFVLPLGINRGFLRGGDASPVLDVLAVLVLSVGLPFVVVSATAPLLQAWFAVTRHPAARDPYFLYAASNLGSMLALLSYPWLVEPRWPLAGAGWLTQTRLWTLGYGLLAALTALCALISRIDARAPVSTSSESGARATSGAAPPATGERPWRRRLYWVALAFVPSSLLLGTTTYITTDIAAVPLLWVPPLALYLLSFILAFGRWPAWAHRVVTAAMLPVVLVVLFLILSDARHRIWVTVLWHLLALFVVSLAVHGELARRRPSARHVTEFYLLISVGGALGGVFNALVAPLIFRSLLEYPLAMAFACVLVRPAGTTTTEPRVRWLDLGIPLAVGGLVFLLFSETLTLRLSLSSLSRVLRTQSVTPWLDPVHSLLNSLVQYGPPLLILFLARRRTLRLGLSLAALLLVATHVDARSTELVHQARSFFGVLKVTRDRDDGGYVQLRHGTTLHGQQSRVPAKRRDPAAYYHRRGPIGQLFAELDNRRGGRRVAVIGLGTGTLAAYGRTGDALTFYEIDRLVVNVASDPAYFTYLENARDRAVLFRLELGDARVRMEAVKTERPGERYDVIVVDAFSSDAIPVHLLTREALRLYLDMLIPGGVIAFHVSNRYLDLEPVLGNLAEDADLGGRLLQQDDSPEEEGASASTWVLLANTRRALGALVRDERWTATPLVGDDRVGVWTDDFHNLLAVFRWK